MSQKHGITKVQILDKNLLIEVHWDSNCMTRRSSDSITHSNPSWLAGSDPRRSVVEQHHLLTPSASTTAARPIQALERNSTQFSTAPETKFFPASKNSKTEIEAKKAEVIEMGQRDVEFQGVTNYPNATDNDDTVCGNAAGALISVLSVILIILTFPFSLCVCLKMVQEYERAVIFRLGRIKEGGPVGPGLFFIIPCMDQIVVTDLRTISFDVPPQEILTKDSVTVAVDAVVYYKIQNPMAAVCNVSDYSKSTRLLASTTLRTILGTRNLSEILSDREHIASAILGQLDSATDPWGIKVERVEVKDVRLPQQLQRAMAAEAEAAREARAKVIAAEGEQKASRALKEASDIISESPAALQLRYLQTLTNISAEKNSTIIFPLPIELLGRFAGKDNVTQV